MYEEETHMSDDRKFKKSVLWSVHWLLTNSMPSRSS